MAAGRKRQVVNISRTLIAFPFFMNGLGVLPQDLTAAALVRAGFTEESVPFFIQAGRAVQLAGGLGVSVREVPEQLPLLY